MNMLECPGVLYQCFSSLVLVTIYSCAHRKYCIIEYLVYSIKIIFYFQYSWYVYIRMF